MMFRSQLPSKFVTRFCSLNPPLSRSVRKKPSPLWVMELPTKKFSLDPVATTKAAESAPQPPAHGRFTKSIRFQVTSLLVEFHSPTPNPELNEKSHSVTVLFEESTSSSPFCALMPRQRRTVLPSDASTQ